MYAEIWRIQYMQAYLQHRISISVNVSSRRGNDRERNAYQNIFPHARFRDTQCRSLRNSRSFKTFKLNIFNGNRTLCSAAGRSIELNEFQQVPAPTHKAKRTLHARITCKHSQKICFFPAKVPLIYLHKTERVSRSLD